MQYLKQNFDAIIIGAGGSGLATALSLSKQNIKKIAIISKVLPNYSHTVAAKGGINASLSNVEEDSWLFHAFDTIKGSDYIADTDSVEILCSQAKKSILELEEIGVVFSRNNEGKIAQRAYGGQTKNFGQDKKVHRACYSKDDTGNAIHRSLYQQCLKNNIKFFNEFLVVDLIIDKLKKCHGCLAIDLNNGLLNFFQSKSTIIATGGYSQIFNNTTSSTICNGDGLAYVFENGIPLQDMEFLQFHPTGIYNQGFLITEACRGEGGYLLNNKNERFLNKYDPKMMELASRDLIARAMSQEIKDGFGCGDQRDHLYLDLRHLGQDKLRTKLPGVVEMVKKFCNLDPLIDLIPVSPSAHYTMGGIPTNNQCNVLSSNLEEVNGLFAVGEAACISVHGANRLGCNSLLDLIVFGKIAGINAAKHILTYEINQIFDFQTTLQKSLAKFSKKFNKNTDNNINLWQLRLDFKKYNDLNLGVFRDHDIINNGIAYCQKLLSTLKSYNFKNHSLLWNDELIAYYELKSLVLCAYASYFCALNRKESRGAHYRNDYKTKSKEFQNHSVVIMDDNCKLVYSLKSVRRKSKYKELNEIQ